MGVLQSKKKIKMILNIDQHDKDKIVFKDSSGQSITYGELIDFCKKLGKYNLSRSLAFITARNDVGGAAWIVAMLENGIVPLILNDNIDSTLLLELIEIYKPQFLIFPDGASNVTLLEREIIFKYLGYSVLKFDCPKYNLHPDLSHLLSTSGSTGSPKLVRHMYANIEAAALNISTFFNISSSDRPLLVLPIHYTMGLSVIFSHLLKGATILLTSLSMTDANFWNFLKMEKATSFTGVPFSFEILDKMRFFRMDLPYLDLLTQGGGKMPTDLNLKFVNYCIEKGKKWIATYGQSEGTARMAWLPPEFALSKMGSIGIAVPNGRLSVRDPNGKEITTSPAEGEMCYEGKNVTMGYAQCLEDLSKGDERKGFLATGDLVFRDEDGFYFIKGRIGRFLKPFGTRIGLDETEHIIRSNLNCECACTGTDKKMIVYITDSSFKDKVLNIITKKLNLPATFIEIREINALPKNKAGKILYAKLENI